jgi:hypothetical protein
MGHAKLSGFLPNDVMIWVPDFPKAEQGDSTDTNGQIHDFLCAFQYGSR